MIDMPEADSDRRRSADTVAGIVRDVDVDDRHSVDTLDVQRVLATVSERLFGREPAQPRLGRFLLLEQRGSGGMGVVYSAIDPQLDRRVAIKVLRRDREGDAVTAQARLLREARALAKLRHPNVVTIHEVGIVDDRVFLAMELVEGQPLDRWIAEPRPWRDVVRVLIQAGRGLAAAHAQGLVHRDFKPSNVILGDDDRVVVLDFGLARSERPGGTGGSHSHATVDSIDVVTDGRELAGTPPYMSPEQFDGTAIGAASDQFSFCVVAFEALHGRRPFSGSTVSDLADAVRSGAIDPSLRSSDVPAWLDAVVRRGLAVDAVDRFPSMQALLARLERPPRPWWRRPLPWVVTGVAGAAAMAMQWPRAASIEACPSAAPQVDEVWNDGRRQAMRVAFDATALPYSDDARRGAELALDDYGTRWAQAHREACEATRIRGEQSESLMDQRMLCLQERLDALDTLAGLFAEADAALVGNAVAASHELPALEPCADVARWLGPGSPPVVDKRRTRLRRKLARAAAKRHAGLHQIALTEVEAVLAEVGGGQDLDVRIEAELERALCEEKAGAHELAAAAAKQALWDAVQIDDGALQSSAASLLVALVGHQLRRFEDGHDWSRFAAAALARRGDPPQGVSVLEAAEAKLSYAEGDYADAREHQRRALDLYLTGAAPDELRIAQLLAALGLYDAALGLRDEALVHYRRVIELRERLLGPAHPDTGTAYLDLGALLMETGDLEGSLAAYETAGRNWRAVYGPDDLVMARFETNFANTMAAAGHPEEALDHYREAIRVLTLRRGPDDVRTADPYCNLGLALLLLGRREAGLEALEEALRIYRVTVGEAHPTTVQLHISLATALTELDRPGLALEHARIAVEIAREAHGPDHELYAGAKVVEGEALAGLGRLDEAIVAVSEGVSIYQRIEVRASERAEVSFSLARLLARRGATADIEAAAVWAARALDELRGDATRAERADEIDRWLAALDG